MDCILRKENYMIKFKCRVIRERFSSDDFKIYVVAVDKNMYKDVRCNKQGEYIIAGDMQQLTLNMMYDVIAEESTHKTFGLQYTVKSVSTNKPTDLESSRTFLYEIITPIQADTLLEAYPNIIDMIVKNELHTIDFSKTKGIKDATFAKIKSKVVENFSLIEIVDLFKGSISMNMVKKLYDKYGSVNKIKKVLEDDPYRALCDVSRVGFKTADSVILAVEKLGEFKFNDDNLITSKQRMKSCLEFILSENESTGNTNIGVVEVRELCYKLTPECIDKFVECIKEDNDKIHVDMKNRIISTKKAYDTEKYIAESILEMNSNSKVWSIQTELYRESEDGIRLTDEQMNTLSNVCMHNVTILTAPAGSGKSASVQNLISMLKANRKTYMLCTPTGKSSEVLAEYTGEDSGTIHRKLEYNPSRDGNAWGYNVENKLPYDVVIVDEFSMVDIYLMKHLVDAIDTSKTRLLLVFDSYQLASVGCGNLAHDLLTSELIPTTILTKIFRYNEGGLMQVVTKIRNGENFLSSGFTGVEIFGSKKDFIFNEVQQSKLQRQIATIYKKLLNDGYSIQDIMVLSAQNKGEYGTKEINKTIQRLVQKNNTKTFMMSGDNKFYVGDKVLQTVNNYKATTTTFGEDSVFNGNTGVIVSASFNEIVVDYGNKEIVYSKEDAKQLELGYCTTIHKSQGSNAKQVIVAAPKAHTFMLNSNILYVACTRARERVYLLGNIITINRAIKKKENLNRQTWINKFMGRQTTLK